MAKRLAYNEPTLNEFDPESISNIGDEYIKLADIITGDFDL